MNRKPTQNIQLCIQLTKPESKIHCNFIYIRLFNYEVKNQRSTYSL
jgi:hypothetical protein